MKQDDTPQTSWPANRLIELIQRLTGQRVPIEKMRSVLNQNLSLHGPMGFSQFNELLLSLGYDRVGKDFFAFFSQSGRHIATIEELEHMVNRFRVKAILRYGNVKFAFKSLSRKARSKIDDALREVCHSGMLEDFTSRHEPLIKLEAIPRGKTPCLGYIVERELAEQLAKAKEQSKPTSDLELRIKELKQVREAGRRNLDTYLTFDHLDVYVATSMREPHEFWLVNGFIEELFASPLLKPLKLRWFDPTQCYCADRIDKGLVEGLMLKRARSTIYLAQESDTLGKDSELASTLAQGKPVIAYVPRLESYEAFGSTAMQIVQELYPGQELTQVTRRYIPLFMPRGAWENREVRQWLDDDKTIDLETILRLTYKSAKNMYENRARTLKDVHPLGLQVNLQTGVANGVLVARTVEECAKLLRGIMLCDLEFDIEEPTSQTPLILLRERMTKSVFRVVTQDELLTNTFWNFYKENGVA